MNIGSVYSKHNTHTCKHMYDLLELLILLHSISVIFKTFMQVIFIQVKVKVKY